MADWNSKQYLKFTKERTQPAIDLVNRIVIEAPKKIIDIGCGPGNSTNVLKQRFPNAHIIGIDNSPDMIEAAKKEYPSIEFMLCDASRELSMLDNDFDIVFSNACIQWIPDHNRLLRNMILMVKSGGVLAVQIPDHFTAPIHKIIGMVSASPKWRSKFQFTRVMYTLSQSEYYDLLADISTSFSIWQTTYFHVMNSHNAIIEWYRGTGLRPYLNELNDEEQSAFEKDIFAETEKAYPLQKNGDIIFRFPRLFFIASPLLNMP